MPLGATTANVAEALAPDAIDRLAGENEAAHPLGTAADMANDDAVQPLPLLLRTVTV